MYDWADAEKVVEFDVVPVAGEAEGAAVAERAIIAAATCVVMVARSVQAADMTEGAEAIADGLVAVVGALMVGLTTERFL